jgi:hypothetical protein
MSVILEHKIEFSSYIASLKACSFHYEVKCFQHSYSANSFDTFQQNTIRKHTPWTLRRLACGCFQQPLPFPESFFHQNSFGNADKRYILQSFSFFGKSDYRFVHSYIKWADFYDHSACRAYE